MFYLALVHCVVYCVDMYIARATWPSANGKSYESIYLRESYRDGTHVRKRNIANLTHCDPKEIAAIELALRHKNNLTALASLEQIELHQGPSVGAVWTVYQVAQQLGLRKILGEEFSGHLALWQVLARVLEQGSRLSAVRLAQVHAAGAVLGWQRGFDENDLYDNLTWLSEQQKDIENRLERTLSGLAEEACDNAVLARGNNAREYAACLVELARSVSRSGARLNIVGMAVPGGLLRERLRKIIEIGPRPRISGSWMGCVAVVCAITCAIAVAGTVEHAETKIPLTNQTARSENPKAVAEQPSRPSCRYCPNPEFPDEAKKAKISSASALVEITVSEKGDVDPKNIRVIKDPGHGFAQEAVAVVKKWKFNPATLKDGKPTKTRTTVEVQFA